MDEDGIAGSLPFTLKISLRNIRYGKGRNSPQTYPNICWGPIYIAKQLIIRYKEKQDRGRGLKRLPQR